MRNLLFILFFLSITTSLFAQNEDPSPHPAVDLIRSETRKMFSEAIEGYDGTEFSKSTLEAVLAELDGEDYFSISSSGQRAAFIQSHSFESSLKSILLTLEMQSFAWLDAWVPLDCDGGNPSGECVQDIPGGLQIDEKELSNPETLNSIRGHLNYHWGAWLRAIRRHAISIGAKGNFPDLPYIKRMWRGADKGIYDPETQRTVKPLTEFYHQYPEFAQFKERRRADGSLIDVWVKTKKVPGLLTRYTEVDVIKAGTKLLMVVDDLITKEAGKELLKEWILSVALEVGTEGLFRIFKTIKLPVSLTKISKSPKPFAYSVTAARVKGTSMTMNLLAPNGKKLLIDLSRVFKFSTRFGQGKGYASQTEFMKTFAEVVSSFTENSPFTGKFRSDLWKDYFRTNGAKFLRNTRLVSERVAKELAPDYRRMSAWVNRDPNEYAIEPFTIVFRERVFSKKFLSTLFPWLGPKLRYLRKQTMIHEALHAFWTRNGSTRFYAYGNKQKTFHLEEGFTEFLRKRFSMIDDPQGFLLYEKFENSYPRQYEIIKRLHDALTRKYLKLNHPLSEATQLAYEDIDYFPESIHDFELAIRDGLKDKKHPWAGHPEQHITLAADDGKWKEIYDFIEGLYR